MKRRIIVFLLGMVLLGSCVKKTPITNDPFVNFDVLWTLFDTKYGLFTTKNIDWNRIKAKYYPFLNKNMGDDRLFNVFAAMLSELKDGHVALISPINVYRYKGFIWNSPPNFDDNIVKRKYLKHNPRYFAGGSIATQVLNASSGSPILYIRYASFLSSISNNSLHLLFEYVKQLGIKGLIIDIRNNTGGGIGYAQNLAGCFQKSSFLGAYIRLKLGPAHNQFSDFSPVIAQAELTNKFFGPIVLLTNRSVYSAANLFTAMMKTLPNVTLLGDTTGGGGGMPNSAHLPNGWIVNYSTNELFDVDKREIESGIPPHFNVSLRATDADKDNIIDSACMVLKSKITP